MTKKYILSIDQEAKEYFEKSLSLIESQLKEEIFMTPLISSNKLMIPIIEKNIQDFIQTTVSLIDYYVEGIYNSGKSTSRKKIKLKNAIPEPGNKYVFTNNDQIFIDKYKSHKLTALNKQLDDAVVKYAVEKINSKINGKWYIDGDEEYKVFEYSKQELVDDEMTEIIQIVKTNLDTIYDEVMDILTREILMLFRRAQIEEYRNLGINTITTVSEDESLCCPVCTAKSGKVIEINKMIDEYGLKRGTRHSFCKYSIDPVISYQSQITTIISPSSNVGHHSEYSPSFNDSSLHLNSDIKTNIDFDISQMTFKNVPIEIEYRITKIIKKFQMYGKKFLKETEFIFVDNITDEDDWFQSVKENYIQKGKNDFEATNEALKAQDNLKYKVASFDYENKYYVSIMSFDSQLIEEIITRKIVKDDLVLDDEIKELYETKKHSRHLGNGVVIYENPFISYLAQETPEDYLLESVISYINQPKKLQEVDKKIFEYIKVKIFNNIQFFH